MTGICLYAAVVHAFIAFSRPSSRVHLLFSLLCVDLVVYEVLHMLTYSATALADFIPSLKWELNSILLLFIILAWFAKDYCGQVTRWPVYGITAVFSVLILVNVLLPYSVQFMEVSHLEFTQLPWGETITRPIGKNGAVFFATIFFIFVVFGFVIYSMAKHYYHDRAPTTLAILIAVGICLVMGIEGILVRAGVINFIHLGPFGVLSMVIAMSLALNQEVQEKLHSTEQRFRSLVDQSPFSMQVLSPQGVTLQVNRAWEQLWGVKLDFIEGYNLLQDSQLREKGMMPYIEKGFAGEAVETPPINYNPAENTDIKGPENNRWVRAYIYPIKDDSGAVREVVLAHEDVTEKKQFDDALRLIAEGVSSETGESFFQQLVKRLSQLFGMQYAFVGILEEPDAQHVKTLAVYGNGQHLPNLTYALAATPCAMVIGQHTCVFESGIQNRFPQDQLLKDMGVESYMGTPLFDPDGNPIGIIVLLDNQPLMQVGHIKAVMEIFAVRAAAEIERNKADELLRQQRGSLQEMVDKRTTELHAVIEELEAFSYSVSHDLRAPLRSIDGFSQALVEDYTDVLGDEGRDYLGRIRNNTQRMGLLIDDLLHLSRVTRKDIARQLIDISRLVSKCIEKHQEQNPSRHVEARLAQGVEVKGDPDLLNIVIENLISNAWKYTSKTENAIIEFGVTKQGDKKVYFVKDNGVGFDMKYADKIFGAFQRLHSAQEFEGTGVGLATVMRIIQRHGGEIWADAQPDKGAAFYFSLP